MPFLNAHGLTQYYELLGDGPPIVFIHGALVDHRCWEPQCAALRRSHQVLCYDLRGHGRTGRSGRPNYSVELFADDLNALLGALGIERPLLCGLSLGGMIAQTYALKYPLAGLVLADTLAAAGLSRRDELLRRLLYPRWLMALTVRRLDTDHFARLAIGLTRLTHGSAWLGTRRATREYITSCIEQMQNREVIKTIEAIYRFRLQPLERIECPTLALVGEHEAGIINRHTEEIARRIGNVRLAQIPQAGHISNLDNPSAFNERVLEFLEQVAGARAGPLKEEK